MKESGLFSDDFSIEMGDFVVKKFKKFDRLWRIGEGGSVDQHALFYKGRLYFGSMNHHLYCVNARTGNLLWKYKAKDRIGVVSSPVVYGNTIYIGSYDHNMYAIDADTGQLVWKFPSRAEILSVACVHDGIVYFTSRDHNLYALTADKGELLWKFQTQDEMQSSPTVFGNKLFFGSYDKNLYCLDISNGSLMWKFRTGEEVLNSPRHLIHEGIIYFASYDNYLYAVDVETGRQVWRKMLGYYGPISTPTLHKNVLYQPSKDGILFALTLDGRELWKFKKNSIVGTPIVHKDRIYLPCEDKNLYCIGLSGKELWKFHTQGPVWWKPTIWNDIVYFGSYDCHLYAVNINTRKLEWKFRCQGSPSYLPPPNDAYEFQLKITGEAFKETKREKKYEMGVAEDEKGSGAYKTRVTYHVSTQYSEKGKYQIDSDEEAF
jgi:outer membrane protein assembly factor BamB